MKLTAAQFRWLVWLRDNGGIGVPDGLVVTAGNAESGTAAPICFLQLLVKGACEIREHRIYISAEGYRLASPFPGERACA